jgi:hypothetical protein
MKLEQEQWNDLGWASDVLAGRGDEYDSYEIAKDMLSTLSGHGATSELRSAATSVLTNSTKAAA